MGVKIWPEGSSGWSPPWKQVPRQSRRHLPLTEAGHLARCGAPNFGPVLVGLYLQKNVKATNTRSSSLAINVDRSFNANG